MMLMEVLGHIRERVYIIRGEHFMLLSSGQAASGALTSDLMWASVDRISTFKNTLSVELVPEDKDELDF
jgi:hypothetical protein